MAEDEEGKGQEKNEEQHDQALVVDGVSETGAEKVNIRRERAERLLKAMGAR